jgi:hypothetical protein
MNSMPAASSAALTSSKVEERLGGDVAIDVSFQAAAPTIPNYSRFAEIGLRSRTPGPPPFSSMNSMPADSNARFRAKMVGSWAAKNPGCASRRLMVGSDTDDLAAKSFCSHRNSALAALMSSLVIITHSIPDASFDT